MIKVNVDFSKKLIADALYKAGNLTSPPWGDVKKPQR
jgi:hypothetical protein